MKTSKRGPLLSKLLAMLLAVVLVATLVPALALAQGEEVAIEEVPVTVADRIADTVSIDLAVLPGVIYAADAQSIQSIIIGGIALSQAQGDYTLGAGTIEISAAGAAKLPVGTYELRAAFADAEETATIIISDSTPVVTPEENVEQEEEVVEQVEEGEQEDGLAVTPLVGDVSTQGAGDARITKLTLHEGSPEGAEVANLLTNPNPTLTVNKEYYMAVEVTKDSADDCWVSLDFPYWVTPNNMIGKTSWNKPGSAVDHTAIDKVLAFTAATSNGTGNPGDGSKVFVSGAGKVTYHLRTDVEVASFVVSFTPNTQYYIGSTNGSGDQLVQAAANQISVACGDMTGEAIGTTAHVVATTSVTKTSTGLGSLTISNARAWPVVAGGETGTIGQQMYNNGGSTDETPKAIMTKLEFDLVLPADWPTGSTIDDVQYHESSFDSDLSTINPDGSGHYVFSFPKGMHGDKLLYVIATMHKDSPEKKYEIGIKNVKATTYGDENASIRTGETTYYITVKNTLEVSLTGETNTRYDWYGEQGVQQNSLIGTAKLSASGATSSTSKPQTIHAEFASNAIVRAITVPKFTDPGTNITLTTRSGASYTGPLADVAKLANGSSYAVIRNIDIPGVGSSEDSIASVTYDVGALSGGSSSKNAGTVYDYYAHRRLAVWGSITNGQTATSTYTTYETGTDPSDSDNTTVKQTNVAGKPSDKVPTISSSLNPISMSSTKLIAGESTVVTASYFPWDYNYGDTVYNYEPTFYLAFPKGFGYQNLTIDGVAVAGVDVTTQAAKDAGLTIYKFESPAGTWAGTYGPEGTVRATAVKYTLITEKSVNPNTYNMRDYIWAANSGFASEHVASWTAINHADTYGINGGKSLGGWKTCPFNVQENKEVVVSNAMRVTDENGQNWSSWMTYSNTDPNNTRAYMNTGMEAEYKVTITNNTGGAVSSLDVFVPIPKTGQNFGPAFQPYGAAEYDLTFTEKTLPAGLKLTYLKMNAGKTYAVGTVPEAGDYTEVANPADADMIHISATQSFADGASLDVIFDVALPTLDGNYGKVNIWNVAPRYGAGSSVFKPTGAPEAIEITGGVLQGTVYEDINGNGIMDGSEVGLGNVAITATDTFNPARVLTTTTDSNGNYTLTMVRNTVTASGFTNSGLTLTLKVDNPDGTTYAFSPTTTTGNKPSVVSPAADQTSASLSGISCVGTAAQTVDAGLVPAKTVSYASSTGGGIGSPASESVLFGGSPASVPSTTPDAHYDFKGWKLDSAVTASADITVGSTTYTKGTSIPAGTLLSSADLAKVIVTKDLTATATFAPTAYGYKVEHYQVSSAGTKLVATDLESGTIGATVSGKQKTFTGYTYNPLHKDAKPSGMVNDSGTLVLKMYYNINMCTLTYYGNNNTGGSAPAAVTKEYGSTVTVASQGSLVRSGYTFQGWATSANGPVVYGVNSSIQLKGNVNLYAVWTANAATPTYSVSYAAGGSAVTGLPAGQSGLSQGATVTVGNAPSREGYTFTGWTSSAGGTYQPGSSFTMPAANVVLTAGWEPLTFTIIFLDHDGKELQKTVVNYGEGTTAPTVKTHGGYVFERWDTDSSAWTNVTADATIKAICNNQTSTPTPSTTTEPPSGGGGGIVDAALEQGIPNVGVPLVAPSGWAAWALLNLILVIVGAVYALVMLIAYARRKRVFNKRIEEAQEQQEEARKQGYATWAEVDAQQREDEQDKLKKQKGLVWLVITAVLAVVGAIIFILTEDMTLPMVWVDGWTIVNAIVLLAGVICGVVGIRRTKKVELEEEDQSAATQVA